MTTLNEQYGYLHALKVGEFDEMDNSAENHKPAYKRKFYSQISSIIYLMNLKLNGKHFMVRSFDGDKLRVYRVSDGVTTIELPETSLASVREHALKKAAEALQHKRDEQRAMKIIEGEERNLNRPEAQNRPLYNEADTDFRKELHKVLSKAGLLPKASSSDKTWYLVLVGDVPMGACNTLANAKQTAKLYKSAKVLEVGPV